MVFPNFLAPSTVIDLSVRALQSTLGGAAPASQKLRLAIAQQLQTQWCWAATSSSISAFYDPKSRWSQCLVANTSLARPDCCAGGASDAVKCNRPWYLDRALLVTGNFVRVEGRALTFAEVQAEVARNAPVGTRVGWYGGGGHFQAIVGWLVGESGMEYLDVSDPIYLQTQIAFSLFASTYQSGGDWTHSYITQPQGSLATAATGQAQLAFAAHDLSALGA